MSKEPLQPQDKYVLRLPDGMRDRIKDAAEANNRSMNAEIIARLEESFDSTIFETAIQQSKTLRAQGETLDAQTKALQAQAKAMEAWRSDMLKMERSLASLAVAIDEAARGEPAALEHFLDLARKKPLPKPLRREKAKPKDKTDE